jgi:hypothetical protein
MGLSYTSLNLSQGRGGTLALVGLSAHNPLSKDFRIGEVLKTPSYCRDCTSRD